MEFKIDHFSRKLKPNSFSIIAMYVHTNQCPSPDLTTVTNLDKKSIEIQRHTIFSIDTILGVKFYIRVHIFSIIVYSGSYNVATKTILLPIGTRA
jgi:hypothetical protein